MLNEQLISTVLQPLSLTSTIAEGLNWLEQFHCQQLVVVDGHQFLGIVSEESLLNHDEHLTLAEIRYEFLPFFAVAGGNIIHAARYLLERGLQLLPVVDNEGQLIGILEQRDLINELARLTGVFEDGAMLVLEMEAHRFSIGELARLVETNNASITQINTYRTPNAPNLQIILRLNSREISDVVASLQRYDYAIIYYSGEELYENELKRNYNHLINYLSI